MQQPLDWTARIVNDPGILAGKATIKGTRLAVDMVLDYLAAGWSHADLLESFPSLTEEGIRACLGYAAESVRAGRVLTLGPI